MIPRLLEATTPATARALRLEIRRGDAALDLLGRPGFLDAWRALYQACPWATAFQDAPFADVWYRSYRTRFAPVVVAGWTDATLTGLLLLAVSHDGTALCHVGAHHAEYQVWLSTDDRFVGAALDALADTFPGRGLQLLFVPPGVAFTPPERWRSRCFRRPISAPYLATNPADAVRSSLRKKSNKSKLGRLTRRGSFSFERVCDDDAFAALLDEIVPLYELRQGAAHDALPFRHDDLKKAFYLAMQRETDLLHVTVMRVEDELIAAHIGLRSRNTVLAGMMAQSPRYAKQSAGKLLFFELALLLEREGVDALDLTPGGEYKDRFATHFEEASTVTILFSHSAAWRHRQQRRLIDAVKRRGVSTDSVKRAIRAARHTVSHLRPADLPLKVARRVKRAVWDDVELRIYRLGRASVTHPESVSLARDRFEDLACYAPAERWQPTTTAFLRSAMERLENGEHCYTYVEDGVLAHYGWLAERQESTFMEEVRQSWRLPPGSAVLYGFYTHPRFRGRGLYASALRRMIKDAATIPGLGEIYIGVRADNGPSRRVIEKVGFLYDRSFYARRRLASVRRWPGASGAVDGATAQP
jgi:CelD/BcsL family acetyltransferase involved in cellulose biosynthesis/RimJ/RimL family protein N-acetyltransferase